MEIHLSIFFFLAGNLLSLLLISATFYVVGRRIATTIDYSELWQEIAVSTTLGFGVTASLLFGLGLLHILNRPTVLAMVLLLHLASYRVWLSSLRRISSAMGSVRIRGLRTPMVVGLFVLVVAAPMLLLTLYPPTHFDATMYHLPFAKAFVESSSLPFLETLRFPIFPQLQEMIFVLGFFLSGETAAQMSQFLALTLTALVLIAWGTSLAGRRVGWWSAALWLGNPLAVWLGASAMIDIGLTLFVTAGLFAWHRWLRGAGRQWLVLAGGFIAFACASKYLGLFFFAALIPATVLVALRRSDRGSALLFPLTVIAIAGPWYARIVYSTGNPVFPYYSRLFGHSEWSDQLTAEAVGAASWPAVVLQQVADIVAGIGFLFLVPYNAVFARESFNLQAPISPWFVVLIPALGVFVLGHRTGRWIVVLTLAYGLFWLTTIRDIRFLLPIMPIGGLALALAADSLVRKKLNRARARVGIAVAVACLLITPGWVYACFKTAQFGPPPATPLSRTEFLSRQVTGYDAIHLLNQTAGPRYTVYSLHAENLRYFADGRFLGDHFGPYRYAKMVGLLKDPQRLHEWLDGLAIDSLLILQTGPHAETGHPSFSDFFSVVSETPEYLLVEPRVLPGPTHQDRTPRS